LLKVLKWIVDFWEKVETRAKASTEELNQLLDQAGRVELEMKNTVVSFNNLFYRKKIDHASIAPDRYIFPFLKYK
jgi:uncharacterized protein Smg (DUF494 family)